MPKSLFQLSFLPVLAFVISGCSSLDLPEGPKWPGMEEKPQIPNEIVDVWADDILHRSGETSKRGFGGRLMFYNRESEVPIKVEGGLTVYLFDDRGEDPMREAPLHKFIFPPETLEKHHSKSELGHSYSFWLPVDEVGGVEKKLTIIARFDSAVGGKVLGTPSTHVLPGVPVEDQPVRPLVQQFEASKFVKEASGDVRQVAHVELVPEDNQSEPQQAGITTATINLPPAFTRQITNTSPQATFGTPAKLPPVAAPTVSNSAVVNPGSATVPFAQTTLPGQTSAANQTAASTSPSTPSARFQLSRFPVRREALGRPVASRVRTQPFRATWPSALPSTPRAAPLSGSSATPTDAASSPSPWPEQEQW